MRIVAKYRAFYKKKPGHEVPGRPLICRSKEKSGHPTGSGEPCQTPNSLYFFFHKVYSAQGLQFERYKKEAAKSF
jgi:hypothetical protein